MKHKISRKEMKHDEFARTIGGLTGTLESHLRSIVIGVVALVVLAAAVLVGWRYSVSRELESKSRLAEVQRAEATAVSDDGMIEGAYATRDEKYRDVLRLSELVLAEHPGSTAALWAAYYKALSQRELGRIDEALSSIEPLKQQSQQPFIASTSRVLEARILEERGDLEGAVAAYASLAAAAPEGFPVEMALSNQARILEAQGKSEEAREIYRRITQDFPRSPFANEAFQRIQSG